MLWTSQNHCSSLSPCAKKPRAGALSSHLFVTWFSYSRTVGTRALHTDSTRTVWEMTEVVLPYLTPVPFFSYAFSEHNFQRCYVFKRFIYLREWERVRMRERARGGGWRVRAETGRESLKQTPSWAWTPTRGSISWLWDRDLSWRLTAPPKVPHHFISK